MKKKVSLIILAVVVFGALIVGCSNNKKSSSDSSVVKVSIQPYPLYAPIYIAKELGYLEESLKDTNIEVKWQSFKSGTLVNESFAAGESDIGVLGDVPAIIAKGSGQDIEIISNVAYGEKSLAILVAKDSSISDPAQLKGKKVAYVKGSYAHHLLSIILENEGLTFKDIESVNLDAADIQVAINNGQVDAGVLWEPYVTLGEKSGLEKVLVDGTNVKRSNLVAMANKEYAENNSEVVEAFIKAYNQGCDYLNENPEEAAKLISDELNVSEDDLIDIFKNLNYTAEITSDDISELKVVEKFLKDESLISNEVDIDKLVNTKYLENSK